MKDYFDIKFIVDGIQYDAQVWPFYDMEDLNAYQLTYGPTRQRGVEKMFYLRKLNGQWIEETLTAGHKHASDKLAAAMGKEIDAYRYIDDELEQ